ncbi:hypothetical protein NLG97_g5530 [Lecanicillium saksenae]|uniref:Uncharacterized protein n=1 Tax=Lecanicillium saksenae TaxID=468837 RepID=A0ACC1QSR1_9HYPO|nr:hypothetical protein NLG97_g5530 [Lecanicillium saksenae]
MSQNTPITVLLIHGAWHGPWCWKYQVPELQKLGYDVETIHLPTAQGVAGKTQLDDSNVVRSVLERLLSANKRVVVLAHSYAGSIGLAAMIGLSEQEQTSKELPGGVVGFIGLCAFIFPGGFDKAAATRAKTGPGLLIWDSPSEGLFVLIDPRGTLFPPDVSQAQIDWAIPQLMPQSSLSHGVVPSQAWENDAEHYADKLGYIICTDDRVIPLNSQKRMIEGAGGANKWITRELQGSSHSPFLSRPREVASAVHEIIQQFGS